MPPHSPGVADRRPRFFYGWVIVGLSFVIMSFHQSARFGFGTFQVPLIQEFGWGRGVLGGAYAVMLGVYALGSPFIGSLLDRKGPRAVIPWGSVLVGAGLALSFFISKLWHVYLFSGLLIGGGMCMSGFATHSALMPRWFRRRRGLATGLALSGSGLGILVLIPAVERIIAHWGWRYAYLIFGLTLLTVVTPMAWLLLRNNPEDVGQSRDGLQPEQTPTEEAGLHGGPKPSIATTFREVRGERNFWALLTIVFFIGLNNNIVLSQLQLYLVDTKFSTALAAAIFGSIGAIRVLGSLFIGWVSDRTGRQRAQALSATISATGIGILMLIPLPGGAASVALGWLFVVVYGIGVGGMGTCHSTMSADSFGGPTFGVVIGLLELFFGLGGFLGPPLAGFMFDYTGSYVIPFGVILAGMVTAIFIALFVYKQPERVR